jgi:hypothetical protein
VIVRCGDGGASSQRHGQAGFDQQCFNIAFLASARILLRQRV